jgi:serine/threonine-protein kinase
MSSPSAQTLLDLEQLLVGPKGEDRSIKAWELVTRAQGNPDFHVVLDFATDKELVVPCGVADPKREPNLAWTNPLDGSEMVWIPPGKFRFGPDKQVAELPGFSLAKHPVTNRQFGHFLGQTEYEAAESQETEDSDEGEYMNGEFLQHWEGGKMPKKLADHPVVYVSYFDALAYCEWAGLSIPGEFMWEKAARGTDGRVFPWGDDTPTKTVRDERRYRQVATHGHFMATETTKVTKLPDIRSPYGCEQMAGNVSVWCQLGDEKKPGEFPPLRPTPKQPTARKPVQAAVRGGAFKRQGASTLRAFHRRNLSVIRRNDWVGIRPACFLPVRPAE